MASRIVALSGPAGSGKSEVAKHLVENFGFELVKFASPLKDMLRVFYMTQGLLDPVEIDRRIEGDLKEDPCPYLCGRTPRHAMQTIGTEWGRDSIHPDFWIRAWSRRVALVPGPVVTDDCRFENEAKAILAEHGDVILLKPKALRRSRSSHTSESGLPEDLVSHAITNDSTLAALFEKVAEFVFDH
jgi:hypothetical protein